MDAAAHAFLQLTSEGVFLIFDQAQTFLLLFQLAYPIGLLPLDVLLPAPSFGLLCRTHFLGFGTEGEAGEKEHRTPTDEQADGTENRDRPCLDFSDCRGQGRGVELDLIGDENFTIRIEQIGGMLLQNRFRGELVIMIAGELAAGFASQQGHMRAEHAVDGVHAMQRVDVNHQIADGPQSSYGHDHTQ